MTFIFSCDPLLNAHRMYLTSNTSLLQLLCNIGLVKFKDLVAALILLVFFFATGYLDAVFDNKHRMLFSYVEYVSLQCYCVLVAF